MAVSVSDVSGILREKTIKQYKLEQFSSSRINYKDVEFNLIDKVSGNLSYEEFFKSYLVKNKPCIISQKPADILGWEIQKWVTEAGTPNWKIISEEYGSSIVPVADCAVKEYNSQKKEYVLLSQYIRYCEKLVKENYDYTTMPCLYLKDWHLCRSQPQFQAYQTPEFFESDWLNSFYITRMEMEDDYRFVYIGPKGSWTPFHADVFGSYSWSANVCGRKRWLLFPPGAEVYFKDVNGKLAFDIESPDLKDTSKYPKASDYFDKYCGIEVIQEAGEIIFVPSGWHHQVWNLEDTISVNHNWLNGCNIDLIYENMSFALKEVTEELNDCQSDENWFQTCQLVLHAHHGINYGEFIQLLSFVVKEAEKTFTQGKNNQYHSVFDLQSVLFVINLLRKKDSELLQKLRLWQPMLDLEASIECFLLSVPSC